MSTILDKILATKRGVIAESKAKRSVGELQAAAKDAPPTRSLFDALSQAAPRIIAEVKKASPSKGIIREDFDAVAIAEAYARGGAAAISVLTDVEYFQGSLDYLVAIRAAVDVPLLRKDFIVDPYQVYEARVAGADAILLILAALDNASLMELRDLAQDLGMDVLWEIHNEEEKARVLELEPRVVGVNNRDLKTFTVDLETTKRLIPGLPEGSVAVSESGFFAADELSQMITWGANAFLIGESLMRAEDPGDALAQLIAETRAGLTP